MNHSPQKMLPLLKEKWLGLALKMGFPTKTGEDIWIFLKDHYQGKNRHYHNFSHIYHSLSYLEKFEDQVLQLNDLSYAIWFHDVIYKAHKSNNEIRSAEIAYQYLDELPAPTISQERKQHIFQLIEATQKHNPIGDHEDMKWMLDIDLAILGTPRKTYEEYIHAIRKEYRMYPDFLFKPGRRKVIQHFLARERLYFTSPFYQDREEKARENLRWELGQL